MLSLYCWNPIIQYNDVIVQSDLGVLPLEWAVLLSVNKSDRISTGVGSRSWLVKNPTCYRRLLFCWNGPCEEAVTALVKMMHRLWWIKRSAWELFYFLTKDLKVALTQSKKPQWPTFFFVFRFPGWCSKLHETFCLMQLHVRLYSWCSLM